RRREFHCALTGAAISVDPDIFLTEFFHSRGHANFSGLHDRELDAALDDGREHLDKDARLSAYRRASRRLAELVPAVYLRRGCSIIASRKHLRPRAPYPDHLLRLHDLVVETPRRVEEVSTHKERKTHGSKKRSQSRALAQRVRGRSK